MSTKSTRAACGIRVVASSLPTREAVAAARLELAGEILQHIIVFFSNEHDPEILLDALKRDFNDTSVSGCSTSGEIGPLGMMKGGIVIIAFPENGFRLMSEVITDIDKGGVERASEIARRLRIQMIGSASRSAKEHVFALVLVDGLSNAEEALIAALDLSLNGIELVGGSAGDGLDFQDTVLIYRGNLVQRGAILFVIETELPVRIFKTQNFEPTPVKLVVTAADTANRIVYELNAEPAAAEYAAAIGLRPGDLVELTGRHGLAHARVIARRQSDDSLLRCVLHSFADPVIDRTLALQESLADLNAEPLENQPPPDAPAKKPFPMQNAGSEQLAHALQRPFFEVGHLPGSERLIDTALLIDDRFFHHALADTFGLSLDRAETIVGRWPDSYLPIALKALGFSAAECFLTMTAVLGTIETDREGLHEFVHIYRSIDREKALALVRRWRAEDMAATLRGKLREMAEDHETPPTDAANCDAPKPSRSVK